MAVGNQKILHEYIADGNTTVFPFECRVIHISDLLVMVDGVSTDEFTVAGLNIDVGGSVIFKVAPASGSRVAILRKIPLIREIDYQTNGDLLASTLNMDFDRIWMALQSGSDEIGRALIIPVTKGNYDANGRRIENLADPESPGDAVTKQVMDTAYKKLYDTLENLKVVPELPDTILDTSKFIKANIETQSINGSLDVKKLTENGVRVYSPNNKPTADDIGTLPAAKTVVDDVPIYTVGSHLVCSDWIGNWGLFPFRANELPFGWYFRNGDNYLLSSPQGQALNSLSDNYKADHLITTKEIDGKQYINVPTAFHTDGRGFYERAVDGVTRQVGDIKGDEIRNITGVIKGGGGLVGGAHEETTGALYRTKNTTNVAAGNAWCLVSAFGFDASRVVPTGTENKVLDIGMTPAIFLGV